MQFIQISLIIVLLVLPVSPAYEIDDNVITHINKGLMWMEVEQYEAAINEFQIGIKLRPSTTTTATLYNNLGLTYVQIKQFPKAIIAFQRAIKLNPNFSLYYENLVKAYKEAGIAQTTIEQLLAITEENSQDPGAWYLSGLLYKESDDKKAAKIAFQNYLHLAPGTELAEAAERNVLLLSDGQNGGP